MALSPQWLDELRSRITLSGVIGRNVRLRKAGREFKACCPFHDEKTPSFTVNDEKGFYHCFGCGAHGDAIRWMTDNQGLPFMEAIRELAAEASMEIPAPDPRAARLAEQHASLHDVMTAAQDWFVAMLGSPEGAVARAYLERRGFDAETVRGFGFGYAPDARGAIAGALSGFEERMLIEAGLLIAPNDNGPGKPPYDRFRGRLMLPIADPRGRIVAFGGRVLESASPDAPKYLNSPETFLFDKGRTLYNLHRAAPASRRTGRIVVVEGYMDVIALAAAGIEEAVAPMGTALTEAQIELLWRLAPVPVLCFDGDAAGRRAAMRAIVRVLPLLRPGHSLSIVTLPDGLDPDDLIRRDGVGAMAALLAGGQSLGDMIWAHEREAEPLDTPESKAGLKARLLAHAEAIADPDIRSLYRRELLDRYGAVAFPPRERPFRRRFDGSRPALGREDTGRLKAMTPAAVRRRLTGAVLAGLLRHPRAIAIQAEMLARLRPDDAAQARLLDALLALADEGLTDGPGGTDGGTAPDGPLERQQLAPILRERGLSVGKCETIGGMRFAFLADAADEADAMQELAEAIALLVEKPAIEAALAEATARFAVDPEGAFAEQQRLLNRKLEFDRRLLQMAGHRTTEVPR